MMIIGAGGMVGRQATEYFCGEYIVVPLTRAALSVTDYHALKQMFSLYKPDTVLNCAVIRNNECLKNPRLAEEVNAEGVQKLAACCRMFDAVLVQLSTDYVFEGNHGGSYTEETIPYPVSLYSRTKRAGELFALGENRKTFVIRTGWLYGKYGDNFVHKILNKVRLEHEISIIADQYGNPTSVNELLHMIHCILKTDIYGIYHAVCSGKTSRLLFAQRIVQEAGYTIPVYEISSRTDKRLDTSLSVNRLYQITKYQPIRWSEALMRYLKEVKHENSVKESNRCFKNRDGTA